MLSQFLVSRFVKDYKNTQSEKVRGAYGYLGGTIGKENFTTSIIFANIPGLY